jgi:glycosyltransferase involved in cell wall biosynthesis
MKTDRPLISIIVPSFDQGCYIEETITSILGQSYPRIELIVIDGGSTDETGTIIQKYADSISYYVSEPDRGQADAINKGFRAAKGEILAWLNSDDMYMPGALEKIANAIGDASQPRFVYGGCLTFGQGRAYAKAYMPPEFDAELLSYRLYINQAASFWTRSLWEKTGELNEEYHYILDWDWFFRASKHCAFTPLRQFLSLYRYHEMHKTGTGGTVRRKEIVRLVEAIGGKDWAAAYRDAEAQFDPLREGLAKLRKFRLFRWRRFFFPQLYFRHGAKRLETALSQFSV